MHVPFRLAHLAGVLLLFAAPLAGAESPMPDPIAPAVVGRPLDWLWPGRPHARKPATARPTPRRQVATGHKPLRRPRPAHVAVAPAHAAPAHAAPARVAPAPAPVPVARTAVPQAAAPRPAPVQALAPRAEPAAQAVANTAGAARAATRTLGAAAFFSSDDLALVRRYYDTHPVSGQAAQWKVGEPIPPRAALTGVPDDLRAALPPLPPGHRYEYVQVDGEVVLVAVPSRVVLAGISRSFR